MKKSILILAAAFMLGSFFTSCRNEVEAEADEVEIMESDEQEVDGTLDDVGNTLEEGVDEVKENTGTGGTDDM